MLAGGTGGAALAAGFQAVRPDDDLSVVANTADDDEFWGLLVSPDVDAVIYRLAGVFNEKAGYGVKDDTFEVLNALARAGEDTWFRIGDLDFATHLLRTDMLRRGSTLTAATLELCRRFGLRARVLPMSDGVLRTKFTTDVGVLSFQEYFVRERLRPSLRAIFFDAPEPPNVSREVRAAVEEADLVVIGPSNPLISIDPILLVIREFISRPKTIAVTPIVSGRALKGPTVEMLRLMGLSPDAVAVAKRYCDIAGTFVLDERDRGLAAAIEGLGYRVVLADTIMRDGGATLARAILRDV